MPLSNRRLIKRIILAVSLITIGAMLITDNPLTEKIIAQPAYEDYSAVWKADRLLVLERDYSWRFRNAVEEKSDEIALGVYLWQVTGRFNNGQFFKETWRAPDHKPVFVLSNDPNFGVGTRIFYREGNNEFGSSDEWLSSIIGSPLTTVESEQGGGVAWHFTVTERPATDSIGAQSSDDNSGRTTSLMRDVVIERNGTVSKAIITADGGYGFSSWFPSLGISTDFIAEGLAIPLIWRVVGKICDTQRECQ